MKRIPTSPDEFPGPEAIRGLSGLEQMRRIASGEFPGAPIAGLIGYGLVEVEEGRVVFEGTPRFDLYNPLGSVHGGWFGVLLDSCMGCAVHSALPTGRSYTTLEYKVNILRAATAETGAIRAEGRAVHVGRRTATAEGRMVDADGRLYATGTTTCLVFEIPPA